MTDTEPTAAEILSTLADHIDAVDRRTLTSWPDQQWLRVAAAIRTVLAELDERDETAAKQEQRIGDLANRAHRAERKAGKLKARNRRQRRMLSSAHAEAARLDADVAVVACADRLARRHAPEETP